MAQDILSIRMDKDLKKEFSEFCSNVGLSISSVINMYARKVVDEQKIPFEISVKKQPDRLGYISEMKTLREKVENGYPKDISIDQIEKIEKEAQERYLNDTYYVSYDKAPSKEDLLLGIDFSISVQNMRENLSKKYPDGMTLEKINEIIDKTRRGED